VDRHLPNFQAVPNPATSPQFKFGRSDRQHKKAVKLQAPDNTVKCDLTGPLKFSIYFAYQEAAMTSRRLPAAMARFMRFLLSPVIPQVRRG
jgi:hypothetical protein